MILTFLKCILFIYPLPSWYLSYVNSCIATVKNKKPLKTKNEFGEFRLNIWFAILYVKEEINMRFIKQKIFLERILIIFSSLYLFIFKFHLKLYSVQLKLHYFLKKNCKLYIKRLIGVGCKNVLFLSVEIRCT